MTVMVVAADKTGHLHIRPVVQRFDQGAGLDRAPVPVNDQGTFEDHQISAGSLTDAGIASPVV